MLVPQRRFQFRLRNKCGWKRSVAQPSGRAEVSHRMTALRVVRFLKQIIGSSPKSGSVPLSAPFRRHCAGISTLACSLRARGCREDIPGSDEHRRDDGTKHESVQSQCQGRRAWRSAQHNRAAQKQAHEWEASFAIDYAKAAIEEAKSAVLDAIVARIEAEKAKAA